MKIKEPSTFIVIIILLIFLGFILFWNALGKFQRFMNEIDFSGDGGRIGVENRLQEQAEGNKGYPEGDIPNQTSTFLGPDNTSNIFSQPQPKVAGVGNDREELEKVVGSGNAGVFDWRERVDYWSDFYSLNERTKETMKKIIMCESSFNPNAIGRSGELGLAQFKKSTFFNEMTYYGLKLDWFKPDDQIRLMAAMLGDDKHHHWTCYNKTAKNL